MFSYLQVNFVILVFNAMQPIYQDNLIQEENEDEEAANHATRIFSSPLNSSLCNRNYVFNVVRQFY